MSNRSTVSTSRQRPRAPSLVADSQAIFSRNLKFWMTERGLKGGDLAKRLEKDPTAISKWVNGANGPDMRTIGLIAMILEVPITELFRDAATLKVRLTTSRTSVT